MILVLNGPSSAGKSTLARAIQIAARRPFLHLKLDAFLEMAPPRYANHPDAFAFTPVEGADPPEVAIATGPFGARLVSAMRDTLKALHARGFDVIVDDVCFDGAANGYREDFGKALVLVGVDCALPVREAREKARGDRDIGQTRWQEGRVHEGVVYDRLIDTTARTPEDCAADLCAAFDL